MFCERPLFVLLRQQPENLKQNVDVVPFWKNFCGRPCLWCNKHSGVQRGGERGAGPGHPRREGIQRV